MSEHGELKASGQIDQMQTWQSDWGYKIVPQSHDAMPGM
jgi:hypothetical protein